MRECLVRFKVDLGVNEVLDPLELISRILDDNLEAHVLFESIVIINGAVEQVANALLLVGRQDKYLRYLRSKLDGCHVCLVDGHIGEEVLCLRIMQAIVLPEGTRLDH